MTLPQELQGIFKNKQRSYKMVLILALTEEESNDQDLVAEHFRKHFMERESKGLPVDNPPTYLGDSWANLSSAQLRTIIQNPVQALANIIEMNPSQNSVSFKPQIASLLNDEIIRELRDYAQHELESYYGSSNASNFSVRHYFQQVMDGYLKAKREPIKQHPMDQLIRKAIPQEIGKLEFIQAPLMVEGSAGKGNWAAVPWVAIMDERITDTTQKGQYLVYLFSEDMSALYLSFAQGVTEPLKEGKKKAYAFFEQVVREIRSLLPLEGTLKDKEIFLTTNALGEAYQEGTIAYYKYETNNLPSDEQLRADLKNMVDNYRLFVEKKSSLTSNSEPDSTPTFKITMAFLHYVQGVMFYLSKNPDKEVTVQDLLTSNRTVIFKSGDSIKDPEGRLRVFLRVLKDFGLIESDGSKVLLTDAGKSYCSGYMEDHWRFHPKQIKALHNVLNDTNQNNELLQVMRLAIQLVTDLHTFSAKQFQQRFMEAMGTTEWAEATQESRTGFMLNWLEELGYVQKTPEGTYQCLEQGERGIVEPTDDLSVAEKISRIQSFIQSRGFTYPEHLIENFYLSLKTKPFVILAGISGTGKTKLVQLFAEALGATVANGQFRLIPIRPDWSDPSDLLGYSDLSGHFRPGPLTSILLEASKTQNRYKPYFICLDEMNLARVEHYFSDLLSLLETQRRVGERIVIDPILTKEQLNGLEESLECSEDLTIPDNVFLIGTVNMDETTHPFSKKVLDRANTLEFNFIQLGVFPDPVAIEGDANAIVASSSFLRADYLQLQDAYGEYADLIKDTTERLIRVNDILEEIHAHIGFRVRDAISFYMIYNERFGLLPQDTAFDCQLMQKILPRIQGSSQSVKQVLIELYLLCMDKPERNIAALVEDASELYQPWRRGAEPPKAKYPQSAKKLAYMLRRIEEDGFTSFWLS